VAGLRRKLLTVLAVLTCLIPNLWESGIGSDVRKPITAPILGGMVTSTTRVLILMSVFLAFVKEHILRRATLRTSLAPNPE
jgi:copper/silver efflux system protein